MQSQTKRTIKELTLTLQGCMARKNGYMDGYLNPKDKGADHKYAQ